METKMIAANSEETVWKRITADLTQENPPLQYHVLIYHDIHKVQLDIDIDPGGGFESGFETTTLMAVLPEQNGFKFALHHENFIDTIGKFFGMEDKEIGYAEFDNKIIIKTNDIAKTKNIFADKNSREVFQSLTGFSLHIGNRSIYNESTKEDFLAFEIDRGITDITELRRIYTAFATVLTAIEMIGKKKLAENDL
ncbi:MAG TPA: hypothetical protein VK559_02175 [Ferruginibacter sp.]|nr:hypothetical protein [Ferruginibacter sp.]